MNIENETEVTDKRNEARGVYNGFLIALSAYGAVGLVVLLAHLF